MMFTVTWFQGERELSREKAPTFESARDIARARLAAHRIRSGATHVVVRTADGATLFDSRVDMASAAIKAPSLSARLVRRFTMPNASAA